MKFSKKTNIGLTIKRLVRQAANAHNTCPVKIIDGNKVPILIGEGYHYTNASGDLIRHPNAYRKAFGKPIYNPSTLRVEVGSEWLLSSKFCMEQIQLEKLRLFR